MKYQAVLGALILALGLTACGASPVEAPPVSNQPESASVWGDFTLPEEASVAPSSAPTPEATPKPTPEPTPTPPPTPVSLLELMPPGPKVTLEGVSVDSISAGDLTLVSEDQLMEIYPWITRFPEEDELIRTYENAYGSRFSTGLVLCDGLTPPEYPGDGGILFEAVTGETEIWLPLRAFCRQMGLTLRWSEISHRVTVRLPQEPEVDTTLMIHGRAVPVLMYHETSDELFGIEELFVSPYDLREQLQYLYDNGYDPIFFEDLTHLEDYDKPVILTCDDGYIGNYNYLYPMLQEFNMKATVFIITGLIGTENYMTEEQIAEVSDSGLISIQSHTVDHYELETLSESEQRYQMSASKLELARITGKVPYVLCYPSGSYNSITTSVGPEYYSFGLKMNGGMWYTDDDYFRVDRYYVSRYTTLSEFIAMLG